MPKLVLKQCPVCGEWKKTVSATCSFKCSKVLFPPKQKNPDPTPDEIAAACAEFQKTWTPEEEKRRRVGGSRDDRNPIPTGKLVFRTGGIHNLDPQ